MENRISTFFFKYIYAHTHFLAAHLQLQAENKMQIKKNDREDRKCIVLQEVGWKLVSEEY